METVSNGGTMRVLAMPQVVYLDFNGELTSYILWYNIKINNLHKKKIPFV